MPTIILWIILFEQVSSDLVMTLLLYEYSLSYYAKKRTEYHHDHDYCDKNITSE